jgi:hypothetical protein
LGQVGFQFLQFVKASKVGIHASEGRVIEAAAGVRGRHGTRRKSTKRDDSAGAGAAAAVVVVGPQVLLYKMKGVKGYKSENK